MKDEPALPSPQYANMKISLGAVAPLPTLHNQPIRTLEDSWEEFEDALGRRYFFHPKTNTSSWKPPRKQINSDLAEASVDVDAEVCLNNICFVVCSYVHVCTDRSTISSFMLNGKRHIDRVTE